MESMTAREDPAVRVRLLSAEGLSKTYVSTKAVQDVSLSISAGEVIGLVGANGAGKSTLMRVLSGVTRPDSGTLEVGGSTIRWDEYSPSRAAALGIRVVYQELSLSTNLTVYENFYVEHAARYRGPFRRWREEARKAARARLDAVFPGNGIDERQALSALTIAQKQMVEIARAVDDPGLRILILDEPTSSLGVEQTEQLKSYIWSRRSQGVSFIFISHRLNEVMTLVDRVVVMQNGQVKWSGAVADTNEEDLVRRMGETVPRERSAAGPRACAEPGAGASGECSARLTIRGLRTHALRDIDLDLRGGSIVGIGGLEGSGQRELLRAVFAPSGSSARSVERVGRVAYVTGDRKKEGLFPLWSIAENAVISSLARLGGIRPVGRTTGQESVRSWYDRLKVVASGPGAPITSLSGGNQQKVLIARAMISDADIVILDDPTRGVDIQTKLQLYEIFREAADKGKLILWYSTEDEEFEICDEVHILRYGTVVRKLSKGEIDKNSVVNAYFSGEHLKPETASAAKVSKFDVSGIGIPLGAMLLVYVVSGILTPAVFSEFGVTLLIGGSIPLILATLAQMWVIGLSMIDLSVGAFMGLVNVLGATLLETNPPAALACYAVLLLAYAGLGALIHLRQIPAIIVTLGASFIWTGIAYTILSMPGGKAPDWLTAFYNFQFPVIPFVLIIVGVVTVAAVLLHRSRYGTVLRGFGNNAAALERSGWSVLKAYMAGYFLSGLFGLLGGIFVTAVTTGADANATLSYTLLTVAAVVMGGGDLTGGIVSPLGAVFGAITLSLIGALLGFLNLSTNLVAAVQGAILIAVLALRLIGRRRSV